VKSSKKRGLVSNTLSDKLLALLKMARRQSAKAENWGFTELRKPQRLVLMSPLAFYWLVFVDLFCRIPVFAQTANRPSTVSHYRRFLLQF
jgi:hypothetical protein